MLCWYKLIHLEVGWWLGSTLQGDGNCRHGKIDQIIHAYTGTTTPAQPAECWHLGLGTHSKYSQGQKKMKVTLDFSDSVIFILHASIYLCRYSTSILYF